MTNYLLENMDLTDINPLICGWEDCAGGHSYGPAVREYYLIHYILSGSGTFRREEGEERPLSAGDMFLIRPRERTVYAASRTDPWRYVWIGFDGEQCARILERTPFSGGRSTASQPLLSGVFSALKQKEQNTVSVLAALWEIFRVLQGGEKREKTDYVTAAVEYMNRNYAMQLTVAGTAAAVGIDRRYLHRLFSAAMGVSPKEYLTGLRLSRAAALLRQGLNVREAAMSVGYEDAFNFSRIFRRKYGYPPAALRRQGTEEEEKSGQNR